MNNNIPAYSYPGKNHFRSRLKGMLLFVCVLFSRSGSRCGSPLRVAPTPRSQYVGTTRFRDSILRVASTLFCVLFFTACATINPQNIKDAEAHSKLGVSYLKNDQTNQAYVEFQKAIELNPNNKEGLFYLGYINTKYKKYDEAIANYNKAISIDPNYSDAMNNLGVVYLDIEKWDEAIIAFTAALNNPLYNTPERSYTSMGYAYYMKGDYQKAENSLREALIRNPVYTLANQTLGLVYIKLGDDDNAINEFMKVIAVNPEYVEAHWELATIYMRTGKNAKALKHLGIVAEKDNDIKRSKMAIEHIERLKY